MGRAKISAASFRDPSGFVFYHNDTLYRQINNCYREQYKLLNTSGLYSKLVNRGLLISHEEVDGPAVDNSRAWKVIKPEPVTFISYPYEWCFSQLKDAALLTLDIQLIGMEHGMCLKDASAYNVQFHKGRPVLIDTLSFENYIEGQPWVAYRQFCQHFLAPLALMAKVDVRLSKLLLGYIDGIPLDLASRLLPRSTWFKPGLLMHLHGHAITQKKYADSKPAMNGKSKKARHIGKMGLIGIVESLRKTIEKLNLNPGGTEWADYYNATNYSENAFTEKKETIRHFLKNHNPLQVWDLGGNTGVFSRIASEMNIPTVSFDIDHSAVEVNYRQVRDRQESFILPLILDLTNPSPGIGWNSTERNSLLQRGPVDCIMALALIHHLTISNNVPFENCASFFSQLCTHLIIEFVPKEDSQVQRLLSSRIDIFHEYDRLVFETTFSRYFKITDTKHIQNSERTLYMMQKPGT